MTDNHRLEEIRSKLEKGQQALFDKIFGRIEAVEWLKPALTALAVIGALVAALSKLDSGYWGTVMAITGAIVAGIAGLAIALFDYRKIDIGREAKELYGLATESLQIANANGAQVLQIEAETKALDFKRRARLLAIEQMVEAIEAGLIKNADVQQVADAMLRRSIQSIRTAVDYQGTDFFTVSIFRRSREDRIPKMIRIAAQWTDPERAGSKPRAWSLGKGYTGVCWNLAQTNRYSDVVESDTTRPYCARQYPVENADPDREKLYRSVASIPILIGRKNEVWGVVTATSDRAGVFDREASAALAMQNVEMIRDVARIAALLAGVAPRRRPLSALFK